MSKTITKATTEIHITENYWKNTIEKHTSITNNKRCNIANNITSTIIKKKKQIKTISITKYNGIDNIWKIKAKTKNETHIWTNHIKQHNHKTLYNRKTELEMGKT